MVFSNALTQQKPHDEAAQRAISRVSGSAPNTRGFAGILARRASPSADELTDAARVMVAALPDRVCGKVVHLEGCCVAATASQSVVASDRETPALLVARCRLDNRVELTRLVDLPPGETATDAELILAAYDRWGTACVDRLIGDFAFALWDPARQTLFCARDPMGMYSFYYHSTDDYFLFATEAKAILAHRSVRRSLNHVRLATLVVPTARFMDPAATYFAGIFALPAATSMTVTDHGISQRRFWDLDAGVRLGIPSKEVPEALRDLIFHAVAARLPQTGDAAALLSGGLDSSGVVAVAAHILKQQNRRLITLSSVLPPDMDGHYLDEKPYINEFRGWENVEIVYVTAPERGPFDDLAQLVEGGEGPAFTSRHYLYSAFAAAATAASATVLLDGAGGEMGPTNYAIGYLPELLLSGHWLRLGRELRLFARRTHRPLWRTAASAIALPMAPDWTLAMFGRSRRFDTEQSFQKHILNPAFVAQVLGDYGHSLFQQVQHAQRPAWDHRRNQRRIILNHAAGRTQGGGFVGYHTVNMAFPYHDRRLLEFCLAAPGEWKMRDGYQRNLLRAALDGLLPPAIQWRTSKEPFSPDFHRRYNRQRAHVRELLAAIGPSDPIRQIVNIEKLVRLAAHEMQGNRGNTPADFAAMHQVPAGVYLIVFLRQFSEFAQP